MSAQIKASLCCDNCAAVIAEEYAGPKLDFKGTMYAIRQRSKRSGWIRVLGPKGIVLDFCSQKCAAGLT